MARKIAPAEKSAGQKTEDRQPVTVPPRPEHKPAKPAPQFVFDDWASI